MNIKITYPPCPIASHASQPLCRLCIDQNCDRKDVLCCMCEYQNHSSHQTVPVKLFLEQLRKSQGEINANPIEYATRLTEIKQKFFRMLNQFRREMQEHIIALQTKGKMYFNRCEEALLNLAAISKPLSILNDSLDFSSYKKYFARIMSMYSPQDSKGFSLENKFKGLIDGCKQKQKKMIEDLNLLKENVNKFMVKSEQIFGDSFELIPKINTLRWSESLKGAKIKITGPLAEQTNMESSGQRFGLMEQALPSTGKIRWGIKVKKFVGWIGLGICQKNLIKTANYHFNYTNIGHGSYLISTNGYSWSHSVKQFNSAFKTFQFTVNDIVYVEYDPKEGKLRFRKNTGTDKFQLDVVAPNSGDAYHPCVNLCSTGDAVELVYPGLALS